MYYIGKIDRNIYSCITEDIVTDEVIITETQVEHIKNRHPDDYEKYFKYALEILKQPDYILEANKPDTANVVFEVDNFVASTRRWYRQEASFPRDAGVRHACQTQKLRDCTCGLFFL